LKLLISKFALESDWGGEEELHLLLAQKLEKRGHKVSLASSCKEFVNGFRKSGINALKLPYFPDPVSIKALLILPLTAVYFLLMGIIYLAYFRFQDYSRVLFLRLGEKIILTPIAKLMGYKVFWGEHCGFSDWIYKNPLRVFYKLFSRFVVIITPSKVMQKQIQKIAPESNVKILKNTIKEKFILKKAHDEVNITYAGRLSQEKGLFMLLNAYKQLETSRTCLNIIGKGELEKGLKKHAMELGIKNIVFHGFLNQKERDEIYKKSDIFCLFSEFETFGMVLLEAMQAQIAIVSRPNGAIPEIIQNDKTGFLIRDLHDAIWKIKNLVHNPEKRHELTQNAYQYYLKNFSESVFEDQVNQIFI
jgi:glycosyltransferase involved in cell wall biosynthesis